MPERARKSSRAHRVSEWRAATLEAYPMARLLDVLRERIGLTGTKEGCGEGECGACSVEMDGALVNSCLVPVAAGGRREDSHDRGSGAVRGSLHAVQQAFLAYGGAQCGICTPGMILAAVNLLARHPQPSERADSRRARRKSLPLHRVHENFRIGPRRRAADRSRRVRAYVPAYQMETPRDLSGALERMAREPGGWKPFAGGTDLMVLLEAGKLAASRNS